MTLLREIQAAATGTDVPVSTVLRQCLVLAARLDHAPLREWAERELNGYSSGDELPEYRRGGTVEVRGNFSGPFGSGMNNASLPSGNVPEEFREDLFTLDYDAPVSEYEHLLASGEHTFQLVWPADVVAALADSFYENMSCLQAWRVVTSPSLRRVLDAIRTRVLTFALEIEAEAPDAGESEAGDTPIPEERVNQIFHTTIYGSVGAMATGSTDVSQEVEQIVVQGDWNSLRTALLNMGLPAGEVDDLHQAIEQDQAAGHAGELGPATNTWLERIRGRIASGSIAVGQSVTAGVIAAAIGKFLGIG